MTDWHVVVGTVGGLLAMLAVIPYIKDILHGTTRPNTVSFFLWAVLILISIGAQVSAGASWSLALLVGDFIGTFSIFLISLFGYGYGKYGWLEWGCTALAIVAIVAWQLAHEPVLAIMFAVVADLMASIPTIVKAYRDPWSEAPTQWLLIAFASLLAIASTTIFDAANLILPLDILLVNGSIGILAFFGRRLKPKPFLHLH